MTRLAFVILTLLASVSALADETWEIYILAKVPRVCNNICSCGYRQYETQRIKGCFSVKRNAADEPEVTFCSLRNLTHRVGGAEVTYTVTLAEDGVLWHGIGSNRLNRFLMRSVRLAIIAEPSYAIGAEPTEDNSLLLTLSGYGNSDGTMLKGFCAGQVGCACHEYGHTSPTRIWSTDIVV